MKGGFGGKTLKMVVFWVFILICLLMLWAVVTKIKHQHAEDSATTVTQTDQDTEAPPAIQTNTSQALLFNVGPIVLLGCVWVIMWRMTLRRAYRKNPAMQGVYTIDVTPSGLSIQNTAGVSSQNQWSLCEFWRERKDVIAIGFKSGGFFIISLTGVAEAEKAELRGILSAALPKK